MEQVHDALWALIAEIDLDRECVVVARKAVHISVGNFIFEAPRGAYTQLDTLKNERARQAIR